MHHRVIRYDHRDTGRSTWPFEERPYRIADPATDVLAVLDGLGIGRAHLVGMSLGGMLAQMVPADHPDRCLSATPIGTSALSTTPYTCPDGSTVPTGELPVIAPEVLEPWSRPSRITGRRPRRPAGSHTGGYSPVTNSPSTGTTSAPWNSAPPPARGTAAWAPRTAVITPV